VTPIDELLARAVLLDHPAVPQDVIPHQGQDLPAALEADADGPAPRLCGQGQASAVAGHDLQALCEALVSNTPASEVRGFLTEQLPEPGGARILGCILQLTGADDGARFWWQFAAGAGDKAAAYCLYLHHLSLGESEPAAWWQSQTEVDTCPAPDRVTGTHACRTAQAQNSLSAPEPIDNLDTSTPTLLRVFRHLKWRADRSRSEAVDALMQYVPTAVAVGYVTDEPMIDLPMPGVDFADHIGDLLASAANNRTKAPWRRTTSPRLPGRPEHRRPDQHDHATEETEQTVRRRR
jgi:hypothetical protein